MKFVVAASIVLQVIAIGIQTRPSNLLTCVRRPSWLLRIIVSIYIAVPLLATLLAKMSGAADRMKAAMLLMAIAAVAPLLPRKLLKIGVDAGFAESLAAVTMLLAIPLVPITATALGMMFGRTIVVPPSAVAATLAKTFLVPLVVGMVLRAVLQARSIRLGEVAGMAGTALLILVVLLLFIAQRETIFPLAWQSLPVLLVYTAGSLLIGHVIGGPDPGERTALAVATVTRHPGLAILIASAAAPPAMFVPAVLVVVACSAIVAVPYTTWRKHALARETAAAVQAGASAR
jgi:BASS family bile acid:Na+ symporter